MTRGQGGFRHPDRALVEKVVVDQKTIIVKVRPDALLNRDIPITRIGGPKRQYY